MGAPSRRALRAPRPIIAQPRRRNACRFVDVRRPNLARKWPNVARIRPDLGHRNETHLATLLEQRSALSIECGLASRSCARMRARPRRRRRRGRAGPRRGTFRGASRRSRRRGRPRGRRERRRRCRCSARRGRRGRPQPRASGPTPSSPALRSTARARASGSAWSSRTATRGSSRGPLVMCVRDRHAPPDFRRFRPLRSVSCVCSCGGPTSCRA